MKAIIALLVVLLLGMFTVGGYLLYQQAVGQAGQAALVEKKEEPTSSRGNGAVGSITGMKPPQNDADVVSNLDTAISRNHDAVAWLQVPNTDINNVVMQGNDNRYYERRTEDGTEDIYGCYFADYECAMGTSEEYLPNTIIYGHSDLKDNPIGKRFSQLFRFTDADFAAMTPYIYITTPEEKTTWQIFSVFYTDTSFDYIRVNMSTEETLSLAQQACALSIHDFAVKPVAGDKLLTLSTCSVKDKSNAEDMTRRFVVMAKMVTERK